MSENTDRLVARWETSGNDWIELRQSSFDYYYRGNRCGGFAADKTATDAEAIAAMERPWGSLGGAGQVTVLKTDRPSLRRVKC